MRLFSKIAYHSTTQKGLKQFEDFTSDERAMTGEGAMVHGWGLYLQADRQNNREFYLLTLAESERGLQNVRLTIGNDVWVGNRTEDYCPTSNYDCIELYNWESQNKNDFPNDYFIDLMLSSMIMNTFDLDYVKSLWNEILTTIEEHDSEDCDDFPEICLHVTEEDCNHVLSFLNSISESDVQIEDLDIKPHEEGKTEFEKASQYEVRIPDDMIFLSELGHNVDILPSELIKEIVNAHFQSIIGTWTYRASKADDEDELKIYNSEIEKYKKKRDDALSDFTNWYRNNLTDNGRTIYDYMCSVYGSEKNASLALLHYGIDGIEYDGGRDDLCYVIFNCKRLTILNEY